MSETNKNFKDASFENVQDLAGLIVEMEDQLYFRDLCLTL